MNERKIISLLQSEDFLAKLNDAETVTETKKLFKSEGFDLSDEKVKIIMEALESANKKAHNGEMMSEEDLESTSGGGLIKKTLEFIILSALLVEATRVGLKVRQKGGVRNKIKQWIPAVKNVVTDAEDKLVEWISGK